jgi:ABC-type branched-subunit amino acid transport system substrate-binding protein
MGTGVKRPPIGTAWAAWTAAALVVIIATISTITLGKPETLKVSSAPSAGTKAGQPVAGDQTVPGQDVTTGDTPGGPTTGTGTHGTNGNAPAVAANKQTGPVACGPGHNGGATDTGVTANQIKLAATVVKSGVGAAFLSDVEFGMLSVLNRENRKGGICGRQLSLTLNDDGWSASQGQQDIQKYIQEGYFALAVVPSSEGLRAASHGKDIDRAGIPVVGTDGMLADQYTDPWIWPVATSTISFMHVMAANAASRGAKTFGIVYDGQYRFGVEGDSAFKGAVSRLHGSIPSGCDFAVQAGQPTYGTETNSFNSSCSNVDFVALLLEPETAAQWIKDGGYLGTSGKAVGAGGPQTLFTSDFGKQFASNCSGDQCKAKFWVWTGFHPPVPPDNAIPQVKSYVGEVNGTNSQADSNNQFVEGGYLGMEMLVNALEAVGPNLTRQALKDKLDSTDFDSGLTGSVEHFRSGNHFANVSAQAFSLLVSTGSFSGFRSEQTGFLPDQWVNSDVPQD